MNKEKTIYRVLSGIEQGQLLLGKTKFRSPQRAFAAAWNSSKELGYGTVLQYEINNHGEEVLVETYDI